jgi:hypothetical protein
MKKPTRADTEKHEARGRTLHSAVERILASNASIKSQVAESEARARSAGASGKDLRAATAKVLVKRYSDKAALVGGAAGLPALVPGIGSLALGLGGLLTELGVLLKLEVELVLALSHLHGFDIEDPKERQLGFVMASVGTYDASGGNFFVDLARTEGVALWNYGPRQLGKFLITAATGVALTWLSRSFLKLVPFVGIAVGGGINKVLTVRVGERIARDLATRVSLSEAPATAAAKPKKKKAAPAAKKKKVGGLKVAPAPIAAVHPPPSRH